MTHIIFENPGEIDPVAITTFGVSVKEGDNPIGFFGTGLKYAIAILMRNRHEVTIQSGREVLRVSTRAQMVRGEAFELVTINDAPLGFTTQVGKTWELWMAYRELFCNARDESGDAYMAQEIPEPTEGITRVIVAGNEFAAVHADRFEFLLEDRADFTVETLELRDRPSHWYFYRGVRVSRLPHPALFTYNDTLSLELTEDRTAKNPYECPYRIARSMLRSTDKAILRRVLTAPAENLEGHLDFHGWGREPSPEFLAVVGELATDRGARINPTALKLWKEKTRREFEPRQIAMTPVQQKTLERALDFCATIGFPIRGSYPIHVVESLGSETLGMAHDGRIYVAERAFHLGGTKQVASTLIEEYVHLKHDYRDLTRELQSFLFEKLVSLGEELAGAPL